MKSLHWFANLADFFPNELSFRFSILAVAGGELLGLVVKLANPYPLQIDTDVIKESLRIQYIATHGFAGLFLPGDNRPIGYDYIFSFFSWAFHANAGDVLWYSTLITFPLYSLGVLYFAWGFTKNWYKALMASIVATLICGFWTLEGPAVVLPDEISLLATLFFFGFYNSKVRKGYKQFFLWGALLFLVNFGYYYMGFIALPLYIFCQYYPNQKIGFKKPMLLLALALLPLGFFFYSFTSGALLPALPLVEMFGYFNAAYTPIVLIFFIVGIYTNLHSKNPILFYSVLVFAVILFVPIIAPAFPPLGSTALRGEQLLRPSVALVSIAAIFYVSKRAVPKRPIFGAFLIFLVCTPVLAIPYESWLTSSIQVDQWNGIPLNTFDRNEALAGLWLRNFGTPGGFIVSDLESTLILQSLSGLSGVWNPVTFLSNLTSVDQSYYALKSMSNETSLIQELSELGNFSVFYLVIDTRTNQSIQAFTPAVSEHSTNWTNWYAGIVISFPMLSDPPMRQTNLQQVYSNPEVEIYKVAT